jgi:hypothetical protein
LSQDSDDFPFFGEATDGFLREDDVVVGADFEDAAAAGDQRRGDAEFTFQFGRQTGGSRLVASFGAVADVDLHGDPPCAR